MSVDRASASDLEIRLLGPFRIAVDGVVVDERRWDRRKPKALVKLLALQPHARLHREEIMDLLWPELDPKAAANNLHKTIHAARRALEPDLVAGAESSFIETVDGQVSLRAPGRLRIDAVEFEREARRALDASDPAACRAALDLYTGDLLADDPYDEWAGARRELLRALRLDLFRHLARLEESRGDLERAACALRDVLVYDATNEEAHRELMRLYAATGNRQQALRQFRACRDALAEHLDAEPDRETVRLHERIVAGEVAAVAASAPAGLPPNNLPAPISSFVGKEEEIAELAALLRSTRVLTLTGSGGIGKTRLSLEVAARVLAGYPGGVRLVELATLADPGLLPKTVASALGAREEPARPLEETLIDFVGSRRLLLILDNCEHLVPACADLCARLLRACSNLRVLATSREPLGLAGETTWRVAALSLPATDRARSVEEASQFEAVRLFVERARQVAPGFAIDAGNTDAIVNVCRRLDGIPLAIQLAAARVRLLEVEQILERLDDRFRLLGSAGRAAHPHQQTLRATMDWSYGLLADEERRLFARLSVFAGGWTLEAAEAVAGCRLPVAGAVPTATSSIEGLDEETAPATGNRQPATDEVLHHLERLVDKSLVVVDRSDGTVRHRMVETIRQYAAERLAETGEAEAARDAHCFWYLALAEASSERLQGPDETATLAILDAEHDNLRAALHWAVRAARDGEQGLRLCAALWRYWHVRSNHSEGGRWMDAALALEAEGRDASEVRARVLYGAGSLAIDSGHYTRAERMLEECLAFRRERGDARGIAHTLTRLGYVARCLGDNTRAETYQRESLALCRELGDDHGIAHAVTSLGVMAADEGDYERAAGCFSEALTIYRGLGFKRGVMITLHNLGELAQLHGDSERAEALVNESLALSRELSDSLITAYSTYVLGKLANDRGDFRRAEEYFERALQIHRELGDTSGVVYVLDGFACAAAAGDPRRALRLAGAAAGLRDAIKLTLSPTERAVLDRYLDLANAALKPDEVERELALGRRMTLDEAAELALDACR